MGLRAPRDGASHTGGDGQVMGKMNAIYPRTELGWTPAPPPGLSTSVNGVLK